MPIEQPLRIGAGINVGAGINFGGGPFAIISYDSVSDATPKVQPGFYGPEDVTATLNPVGVGSTGFTINNSGASGVLIQNLQGADLSFCSNLIENEYYTMRLGPGSSYEYVIVQVTTVPPNIPQPDPSAGYMIFYIDPSLTYPLTCNFPFNLI
jgi:hypothetical protein